MQEFQERYRGNPYLKTRDQKIEWSQDLIDEYVRCASDPIHFITTHMRIVNQDEGLVPFTLYDYQQEIIETISDNRNTLAVCARQSGKTTAMTGFILWFILFNEHKDVAILANKGRTAIEILGRIQRSYQYLPKWLQQGVVEWNKGSFVLENGCRVIADTTASDTIRGYTFSVVIIDEAAHIDGWAEFYASVYPTIVSGKETKLVLISTPNGLNHFYKFYSLAMQGKNDFQVIEVPWQRVPGRDEKWRTDTIAAMNFDTEKFDQEFANEWLGSSGTLIAGWKLKELVPENPRRQVGGLSVYRDPVEGRTYVIVVDVSRGKGLDYSAFQVVDVTEMPYQQCCVYRSNMITPMDFSGFLHGTAKGYNNAAVLVEINDIGEQVSCSLAYDFEYEYVLSTENAGGSRGKKVSAWHKKGSDLGVRTTPVVKSVGCSMLKLLVEQNQLIVRDGETISELSTFSKKGKSYEAEPGKHDDLAMCFVLFGWLSEQNYFKNLTDINTMRGLRDMSEADIEASIAPFGWTRPNDVLKDSDEPVSADRTDRWLSADQPYVGADPRYRPLSSW